MRIISLLALASTLAGCVERQPSQTGNSPHAVPTRGLPIATSSAPFEEIVDDVAVVAPPLTLTNDAIQIGREVMLVGKCGAVAAKDGCLIITTSSEQEEIISMNGQWPDKVRQFSESRPDSEVGAKVQGVVAEHHGGLYFKSFRVRAIWEEPTSRQSVAPRDKQ